MANFVYNRAAKKMLNGEILPGTHTFKLMLIDNSYTPDRDHDFVSSGAGTVGGAEIAATNYAAGFGGAGRHTLSSPAWTEDDANDRAVLDANDPATWTALGGALNDTIAAAVLITETGASSDADTELIAYFDTLASIATFPLTTNGEDLVLQVNVAGLIHALTNP